MTSREARKGKERQKEREKERETDRQTGTDRLPPICSPPRNRTHDLSGVGTMPNNSATWPWPAKNFGPAHEGP